MKQILLSSKKQVSKKNNREMWRVFAIENGKSVNITLKDVNGNSVERSEFYFTQARKARSFAYIMKAAAGEGNAVIPKKHMAKLNAAVIAEKEIGEDAAADIINAKVAEILENAKTANAIEEYENK